VKKRKKIRPKHRRKAASRAITKHEPLVVYQKQRPVQLTLHQQDLIRRLCAKDANDDEFEVFMQIARTSKLDPFKKEIYCLIFSKYNDKRQMVIVTGIGGYRTMAARDHKDYDGSSKPVFTFADPPRKTPAGRNIPESCTMEIYAKNSTHPTVAELYWDEYSPRDLTDDRADFWNRMPCNQLAKCTESHGIKKRFPGMNNIYVDAELDQKLQDYTPEGRLTHVDGQTESGSIVDQRAYAKARQSQVLDEKLAHGHVPGSLQAKQAEAALGRVEEEDRRLAAARNVTPGQQEARPGPKSRAKAAKSDRGAKRIPAGCTLLTGTIHQIVHGQTSQQKVPFIKLKLNNEWFTIWSKTLHAFFQDRYGMIGNVVECYIKPVRDSIPEIAGLRRINDMHFREDGRTAIAREPGAEG
jgi:phage recombination protein Bet